MSSSSSLFINHIAPSIGVILSTIQYSSTIFTFLKCSKDSNLSNINPIPITINFLNCLSWIIYGILLKNGYLIGSVTCGCFTSLFSIIISLYLLGKENNEKVMKRIQFLLLFYLFLWIFFLFLIIIIKLKSFSILTIIGYFTCIITIIYYYSPLITIKLIIQTKDSSSLHFPMLFMNFVGSFLWTIYGIFGINDPFLYIPCSIGLFFTILLLIVRAIYPPIQNIYENHEDIEEIEINHTTLNEKQQNKMGSNNNNWSSSPLHSNKQQQQEQEQEPEKLKKEQEKQEKGQKQFNLTNSILTNYINSNNSSHKKLQGHENELEYEDNVV